MAKAHFCKGLTTLYSGEEMFGAFEEHFNAMRKGFKGVQYVLDHTTFCITLNKKLAQGATGRLVLDQSQAKASSCARQARRALELFQSGCEMRTLYPGKGFASEPREPGRTSG